MRNEAGMSLLNRSAAPAFNDSRYSDGEMVGGNRCMDYSISTDDAVIADFYFSYQLGPRTNQHPVANARRPAVAAAIS